MAATTMGNCSTELAALLEAVRVAASRPVVAFSGGVDSSVVAAAAVLALGAEAVLCVTAASESNTEEDRALCRELATSRGWRHRELAYSELAIPSYAENPTNRCFFCKDELHRRLSGLLEEVGADVILDGTNADDVGDWRPGREAARRHGVASPLLAAGLGKAAVRQIALELGLPNHDKPASPCLSSRIPYGSPVTKEKLDQVGAAERFLRGLGMREFRCRHHGQVARIEAAPEEFEILLSRRLEVVAQLRKLGFLWVSLDLAGFRSGSLNAVLDKNQQTGVGEAKP